MSFTRCFKIDPIDNVATLLEDAAPGSARVIGETIARLVTVEIQETIQLGHKVALSEVQIGEPILKFGVPIGKASRLVRRGDWVHLHNCLSNFDTRSGSLDLHSGSATDTKYE